MSGTMSTATSVALMDVRNAPYVLTLPKTSDIPYRVLTMKDVYGKASFLSTITVLTQSPDVFEDGTTSKVFTNPNEITQFLAGQPGKWYTIGGTSLNAVSYNTLSSGIITAYTISTQQLFVSSLRGDGSQLQNLAGVSTAAAFTSNTSNYFSTAIMSTVAGLGSAGYISSSQLISSLANFQSGTSTFSTITVAQSGTFSSILTGLFSGSSLVVSSINGNTIGGPLFSTVIGLGSAGYISSSQLISSLANFKSGTSTFSTITVAQTGNFSSVITGLFSGSSLTVSSINGTTVGGPLFSTVIGLGSAGYVSTANLVGLVSTPNLVGLVSTYNLLGLVSTPNLVGLVSTYNLLGLVSTPNLVGLVSTNNLLGLVSTPNLVGLVSTNNLLGLVSTPNLVGLVSTNNLLGLVSTPNLVGLVSTNNLLGLVSTPNLVGLVSTNNLLGLVSTPNLVNLVSTYNLLGLVSTNNLLGLVSTPNLVNLVSTNNLLGLVSTPNLVNLVSTANLVNLVSTNNLLGLVSTPNLVNLVSTTHLYSMLQSTVAGLGSINYISSAQLLSTTSGFQTYLSSQIGLAGNNYYGAVLYLNQSLTTTPYKTLDTTTTGASATTLTNSVDPGTSQAISQFQTDDTMTPFIPNGIWNLALFADSTNPKTYLYMSLYARSGGVDTLIATTITTPTDLYGPVAAITEYPISLAVPYTRTPPGTTVVLKIFASNADSTSATVRTYYEGNTYSFLRTTFGTIIPADSLTSTVAGLGNASYLSSPQLISTVVGLGTANYISSSQLLSTVAGLGNSGYISAANLIGIVSTANLIGHVSTANLLGLVSTPNLLNLVSTQNLLGLVSTPNLVNLVSTNNLLGLVSTPNLLNLVSTQNLLNLVSTNNLLNLVSTQNLLGLVSTPNLLNLVSTQNLLGLVSTPNLVNLVSTNNLLNLVSTQNLLNLVSTNYLGTQMQSTVMGLATVGYVSSTQLLSSLSNANISSMRVTGIANISTLNVSSISSAFLYALQGSVSSLQVNALIIGTGTGVISLGDIIATSISSISTTTNVLYASTATIQITSSLQMFASSFRGDGSQLQNVAGLSTVALFTSNTSNYAKNILQDWSTPVSTVALFTSNTSNYAKNILQDWSTPVSTVALFTSNTSNYAKGILVDWSTPVSTVALFTSNTSNYAKNILQDWSTPVSTVALFTSNTSNYAKNILQDWSTPVSTVALFTSNTSNYAKGILQDWSTPVSTVALFTSNTSNYAKGILVDWSTPVSTVALFTSNTSNYAKGILVDWSTPVSTVSLFTSNTSNYAKNILQDWSTATTSTIIGLGTFGYISTSQFQSSMLGITSNISSMIDPIELASSIVGLGTIGFVSSIGLTNIMNSTVIGLNTYIAAAIDPVELASSIVGLGTMGFISSVGFDAKFGSTVQGLGNAGYISSSQLISSLAGFRSAVSTFSSITVASNAYISSMQVTGFANISTATVSTLSSVFFNALQGSISSLQVNALLIGAGTGSINLGDIVTTSISSISTTTNILYASTATIQITSSFQMFASSFRGDGSQLQNVAGLSTVSIFTSNTSNYAKGILVDWSTPVSTVALFTSNTSNYAKGILQDWSTPVSTVALFTSNTSNYAKGISQDWSTPVSTIALFTSNTSNYAKNILQDWSTATQSTVMGLGSAGYISTGQFQSSMLGITSNISSMIDPIELASSIVGLGTIGFVSSIGLTNIMNSTVIGLNTYIAAAIDPVELTSSIVGLGTMGFISSIGFDAKFGSTLQGLGTAGYISSSQLYSTVTGITVNISTRTLSAGTATISSLSVQYITGTQGYISSLVVDSLAIGSNSGFINMGDIITTSHSSLQINTGIFTASGVVSTPQLIISSINGQTIAQPFQSTVVGLGTLGYLSSLNNVSTISTLNINVSTINGQTIAQPIQSTAIGLGTLGYVSSTQLTSSLTGLATLGYISTSQLNSTVSGLIITAAAAFTGSTILLSAGTINVSTMNSVYLSSVTGYVSSLRTDNLIVGGPKGYVTVQDLTAGTVSTGQLVAGAGFISSLQINSLSFGPTGYVIVGNFIASSLSTMKLNTQNLYTNNAFVGNASTQSAILFPGIDGNFRGTAVAEQTTGPGTEELLLYKVSTVTDQIRMQTTGNIVFEAGVPARSWPSTQMVATPTLYIQGTTSNVGIGTASPATTLDVAGTGRFQVVSTLAINISTINGLTFGAPIQSTMVGLATAGYISSSQLQSSIAGFLFTGSTTTLSSARINVSTLSAQTITVIQGYISSLTVDYLAIGSNLGFMNMGDIITTSHSSLQINTGLLTASGTVCTPQLIISSINGQTIAQPFQSTVAGLGTLGYLSSFNNISTISTLNLNVSSINGQTIAQPIQSTAIGLATLGYVSSTQLTSSLTGLATLGYVSSTQLTSSLTGLATLGYISSTQLNSTVSGLIITAAAAFTGSTILLSAGTINVSTMNSVYLSSVTGYVSSLRTDNLIVGGPKGYVTVQDLTAGTVSTGQLVAGQGFISSLQINSLSFGPTGYVIVGNFIASSLSTMKLNTQNLYTNNAYIGNASTQSAILFPGIDGNFLGTAVAEQTTGPGTEELLLYKVSTVTDQVRVQTTGNIVFEAGVSARSWPSTQMVATPTLYIQGTTSNVGIGTATPATTLDVVGTGRFQVVSTLNINVSTINGSTVPQLVGAPIQSTVIGLGSAGYISTSQFQSSMLGITSNISSMIDPVELASSIVGLGTIGFVSSIGLTNIMNSTVIGLNTYIAAAIDPIELASSIVGLGTMGFVSSIGFDSKFGSTLQGLGTAGYISSSQLYSTVTGITVNISTKTLSAGMATVSSISVQYITGVQGYISSLVVDSLAIGSNSGFINMGDIITTSISSLQINTGIFTASGTVCTPQLIISSINGQTIAQPIQSTAIGLGTLGYLSSFNNLSTLSTLNLNVSSINGQTFGGPIQSTAIGLGTLGYISSSQLFSTVTALMGSTLSLSAGSIFVSSLQGFKISTAQAMVCTVTFQDQMANNPMGNIYQYSSILYYNSYVVAGTTAMNIQSFTF